MTRVIFSAIVIFAELPLTLGIVPFNLGVHTPQKHIYFI